MKKIFIAAILCGTCSLFFGCAARSNSVSQNRHFHESSFTDVVLHFTRWDTIQMLRPDTREAGFLPILDREGLKRELQKRLPNRRLAVVVVPFANSTQRDAQVASEWTAFLSAEH